MVDPKTEWSKSELERKKLVQSGQTVVANQSSDSALIGWAQDNECYVLVDRESIWGNPFILPDDGTREEAIENYRWYYSKKPSLQKKITSLKGKVLGCWCYPLACHGNILKQECERNSNSE